RFSCSANSQATDSKISGRSSLWSRESSCSSNRSRHARGTPDREKQVNEGVRARKSIFPALLLIVLGLLFLLHQINPAFSIGHLARIYWPFLFILWGAAKLIDHITAQSTGEVRAPLLSGAEAALLMLLVFVLVVFVFHDWIRDRFP